MTVLMNDTGLATRMRDGSRSEHEEAESSSFMEEMLAGRVNETGYSEYLAMLRPIYEALEDVGAALAEDPVVGSMIDPGLERLAALDADLAHWSPAGLPAIQSAAVATYVARIRATLDDSILFVAHHYTRYLGDLSGGQAIGKLLGRRFDIKDGSGLTFYAFDQIAKPKPYKDGYRERLDALPINENDKNRVVAEVQAVFALNTALFAELSAQLDRYAL